MLVLMTKYTVNSSIFSSTEKNDFICFTIVLTSKLCYFVHSWYFFKVLMTVDTVNSTIFTLLWLCEGRREQFMYLLYSRKSQPNRFLLSSNCGTRFESVGDPGTGARAHCTIVHVSIL